MSIAGANEDSTAHGAPGAEADGRPARQGEHNEEVLRELAVSDEEISEFNSRGVLVHARDTNCAPLPARSTPTRRSHT